MAVLRKGRFRLDHLQVFAPTLAAGLAHVSTSLGVALDQVPGRHLAIGPDCHLEIVTPEWMRAQKLDPVALGLSARFALGPFLGHWCARLERPGRLTQLADEYPRRVDAPVLREADGRSYLASQRADAGWPRWRGAGDGVLPTLIQWQSEPARADAALCGIALRALRGYHPSVELLAEQLTWLGLDETMTLEPTLLDGSLVAEFDTPTGLRQLR